jgi:hypothetical protein
MVGLSRFRLLSLVLLFTIRVVWPAIKDTQTITAKNTVTASKNTNVIEFSRYTARVSRLAFAA